MAIACYHHNDTASNLTPSALAVVRDMIAKGVKQRTHEECLFTVSDAAPDGWRFVSIEGLDQIAERDDSATDHDLEPRAMGWQP